MDVSGDGSIQPVPATGELIVRGLGRANGLTIGQATNEAGQQVPVIPIVHVFAPVPMVSRLSTLVNSEPMKIDLAIPIVYSSQPSLRLLRKLPTGTWESPVHVCDPLCRP